MIEPRGKEARGKGFKHGPSLLPVLPVSTLTGGRAEGCTTVPYWDGGIYNLTQHAHAMQMQLNTFGSVIEMGITLSYLKEFAGGITDDMLTSQVRPLLSLCITLAVDYSGGQSWLGYCCVPALSLLTDFLFQCFPVSISLHCVLSARHGSMPLKSALHSICVVRHAVHIPVCANAGVAGQPVATPVFHS